MAFAGHAGFASYSPALPAVSSSSLVRTAWGSGGAIMAWKAKLRWWPEALLGICLLWLAYIVWQHWR